MFLSEGITEVGVHRVIHVVLTRCRFFKLQTEADVVANFRIQANIHEHTTVFFTLDAFFAGCITQYGFTVSQQVKLITDTVAGSDFPVAVSWIIWGESALNSWNW